MHHRGPFHQAVATPGMACPPPPMNHNTYPTIEEAHFDACAQGVRMTTNLVKMSKEEVMSYNNCLWAGHGAMGQMPNAFAVVVCQLDPSQDSGMVANCLLSGAAPLQEGTNLIRFFQFPGTQGGCSYGLSHLGIYGGGWALRGAMLNPAGNLASNSLLKQAYSRGHGPNQIVDMICEVSQGIVNVYFEIDGQECGLAYSLDFRHNPHLINSLRPVLQFADSAAGSRVFVATHPVCPLGVSGAPWRQGPTDPVPGNPCM